MILLARPSGWVLARAIESHSGVRIMSVGKARQVSSFTANNCKDVVVVDEGSNGVALPESSPPVVGLLSLCCLVGVGSNGAALPEASPPAWCTGLTTAVV